MIMNLNNPSALSDSLKTAPASGLMPSALSTPLTTSVLSSPFSGRASSIAFIDASVADYQTLVAGIAPGTEVHILDSSQDAITQITNTLLGRHNISSLHIVSHGEAGGLDFGTGKLNLKDLPAYAAQLQSWSNALTDDADLLLYGCNVAQGELGKAFTSILSQLTGADVAASDDLTGSASKGGNWTLEYQTGHIEAGLAVAAATQQHYGGVLDDAVYANAQQFTAGTVTAQKVFTDSAGNVYTTGTFNGTVDFDPGAGTTNLTSAGNSDIFISKLDSSGTYVWAKQLGGTGNDQATGISVDSAGNVYTTGYFQGTADFDPGAGTTNLTSAGSNDIFISKLDSSGSYVWAKQLGGTSTDIANGISVDSAGNVYTTGTFNGTADFDPGAGTANLTSAGSTDIFISKLDSSGTYVWAKQLGGTGNDQATGISVDSAGNVYTTGIFNGTVDFDPGAGTTNLTSAGSSDIFISKLDSSGTYVWAKQLGGTGNDQATGISVDSAGNVYTTGTFNGTADFDPGAGTANLTSAGSTDIFISKLDSSGTYVWAKQLGGTSSDVANGISVDSAGNVYTTGYFSGTADFDPGAGTTNLTSAGSSDIFISKLDSSGSYVWAKQLGGTGTDQATGISVDSAGNVYTTGIFNGTADFDPGAGTVNLLTGGATNSFLSKLTSSGAYAAAQQFTTGTVIAQKVFTDSAGNVYTTGTFNGTVDFDPGAGTTNLTSAGSSDIFISKLDSSGTYVWAKQLGGTGNDQATGISVDSAGNVYTTGTFNGTADFDPGAGTANLTSAGSTDIFISKLDSSGTYVWAKQLGGTSSDVANGISVDSAGNVYTTGNFSGTADFDPGAGTTNLTSAGSSDIFISKLDSSGSYVWAKQLGGSSSDIANGISVDSAGNVYTTGYFSGTADFDPGAGTTNLTSAGGSNDIFISKLDSSGSYVWAKQLGGTSSDIATGISVDSAGNVYTTGYFNGTADFDPGAGTTNLTSAGGSNDIFISKLDSSGSYVWAKQLGGFSSDFANGISVDSAGNVYTTGYFSGTADFDPGAGTTNLTSAGGSNDIFISKLDSSGSYVWAKQLGGFSSDVANGISVDSAGNVYTTGTFFGTADFDPGAGTVNLLTGGITNSFISKLSQAATPTLSLSTTTATLTEGGTAGSFTLNLNQAAASALTVNFTLTGAAGKDTDYTITPGMGISNFDPVAGTFTINAGVTSASFTLQTIDDIAAEAAEGIVLTLTGVDGGYGLGTASSTITIGQNDFVVTNTSDAGEGSLRQAILNANAIAGADTITFAGSTFTDTTPDTITLASGLTIDDAVTLQGTGAANLSIAGTGAIDNGFALFTVNAGKTASFSGLTFQDATYGIRNNGTIASFSNSAISNTRYEGINNSSTGTIALLTNSTISGVQLQGIYNGGTITTLSNTTISGNTSYGIYNDGTLSTLVNNTIAANGTTGILNSGSGTIANLRNNLLVGNGTNTISGTITNQNTNLFGTFAEFYVDSVFKDNGGSTKTYALLPSSMAIDFDLSPGAPTTDQRGISRVGAVDIGAFESRGFTAAITGGNNQSTKVNTAFANPLTVTVSSAFNEPVAGGKINYVSNSSEIPTDPNAFFSGSPATLDSSGNASAIATANNYTGSYMIAVAGSGIATASFSLTNTLPNASPTLTVSGTALNYTENDPATLLDSTATVADTDSANFDTGTLTVDYSANGSIDDRLAIRNQGTSTGQIGVSSNNVTYGGTTIGTLAGGTGTTPLVITFNASATPTAVSALLQNLTYANVSEAPSTAARTVRFVVTDGDGGTSTAATKTISVTAVNDVPTIALPGNTVAYTENAIATLIDGTATIADPDATNFNTGNLTINYTAGGTADDRLTIRNQGTGTGQISLDGRIVKFEGTAIGTYTGGIGTTPLVITFNSASATPAAAQALLRTIAFANVSQAPSTTARSLQVTVSDGSGTSTPATRTINVTAVNDAPIVGSTTVLYDGATGTLPSSAQGWTYAGTGVTPTFSNGATNLNTTANASFAAGFSNTSVVLDRTAGYVVSFNAQVVSESRTATADKDLDGKDDRAGFSIIVVSSDTTKAIELGFLSDRIFAQEDGTNQVDPSLQPDTTAPNVTRTLFTQAEAAAFTTNAATNYDLAIKDDTYTLFANGTAILSGRLRDYTAFSGTPDPYQVPNQIFFGDDTTSAAANLNLSRVAVTTNPATLPSQTVNEDTAIVLPNLFLTDLDAGSNPVTLTLGVTNGTVTVNNVSGSTLSNNGTATVTITGTLTQINTILTNATGITYQGTANYNGSDTLTLSLNDNGASGGSAITTTKTLPIVINAVNDAPSFTKGADQTINEDAVAQSVNWATNLSRGSANESSQTLTFLLSNDNNALFSAQPTIDATGKLTYTAAPNANGTATVTVQLQDNGGVANNGVDTSAAQTFTITVNPVNDAPSFTKGADQTINEDAAAQTVNWATNLSRGSANESSQTLTFLLSNDNNALFSAQPTINAAGNLTYTAAANAHGSATVTVRLKDNGGIANSGVDTSDPQTFTITVNPVNDAPQGTNKTITTLEDTTYTFTTADFGFSDPNDTPANGLQGVQISTLPTAGTLTNNGAAVTAGALITRTDITNGQLRFTPASQANGTNYGSFTFKVQDDGGTTNGGANTDLTARTLTLTVTPVNDAPSFTKGANLTLTAGSGAQILPNWAKGFNPGPADESNQTAQAYLVTVDTNPAIFAVAPKIDAFGNLTYTPATTVASSTTAAISVKVQDSGGTANGGLDTSTVQTFTITVKPQPTISITPVTQAEGNSGTTPYTFTVTLSDTSTQDVRVTYTTADGTATLADGDYSAASGTLLFTPGETSKTFSVNANGDNRYENTEAFLVNLSNAVNGLIAPGSNSVNGTLTNDDTVPVVNITPTVTQAEGNSGTTPYTFTVTLSNPSFEAISLNYRTSDGSATLADGDYAAATGTVTFASGETSKTITVNATGDTKFESGESFQLALTGAATGSGRVTSGNTTGTGTITNDDALPTIRMGNVSQKEGTSGTTAYTFTVSLSNASTQTVSVNCTTADGTATVADGDYLAATSSLTFAPGETSKTITINVQGDPNRELDETFFVNLLTPTNATLDTTANSGTGTIVNDDLVNLLWRSNNPAIKSAGSGQNAVWQMSGFTLDNGYYLPSVADKNWQVMSTADFNHDGTDDLLWRNQATGENAIWQLNSTGFQSGRFITPIADLNWKIVSTADFNGDGIADILWRNQASGQNAIWEMNSTDVKTGYYLTPVADLNWKIVSTADFNGDGIADILWRNQASGQNAIWEMKRDFTLQSGRFITPIADSNWQIVGTADFNHDGIADLVWRNQATGQNAIWEMNSTDVKTGYYLTPVADLNWQIAGIADFDGDGSPDLLWRNAQASKVGIWQMKGFTESQTYLLPDITPDWVVRPLRAPQATQANKFA